MPVERKLASIQKIVSITPIEGADRIEKVRVIGWECIVKKGEFKLGDPCIYIEIDSLVPRAIWSEFLFKDGETKKHKLKTVRMKGQISQGLVLPLTILGDGKYVIGEDDYIRRFEVDEIDLTQDNCFGCLFKEGDNVTGALEIEKYEPYIPAHLQGLVKGTFPSFIPKTDETRIQSEPWILEQMRGREVYLTEKVDGTSFTCYLNDGEFGVCSRNIELKESEGNTYWNIASQYYLETKLRKLKGNLAIQGEIIGHGVQNNKYRMTRVELRVFDVFAINEHRYFNYKELQEFCDTMELKTVPYLGVQILDGTVEEWIEKSKGKSQINSSIEREGIVVRTTTELYIERYGRASFKSINPEFLIKFDE